VLFYVLFVLIVLSHVMFVLIVLFYVLFVLIVSLCVLFVCKCVLYYCHRVSTQLQLKNISYRRTITVGSGEMAVLTLLQTTECVITKLLTARTAPRSSGISPTDSM